MRAVIGRRRPRAERLIAHIGIFCGHLASGLDPSQGWSGSGARSAPRKGGGTPLPEGWEARAHPLQVGQGKVHHVPHWPSPHSAAQGRPHGRSAARHIARHHHGVAVVGEPAAGHTDTIISSACGGTRSRAYPGATSSQMGNTRHQTWASPWTLALRVKSPARARTSRAESPWAARRWGYKESVTAPR